MRIKLQNQILLVNILSILLIMIITLLPSNVLRVILGVPIVLLIPGYTLLVALFPRRDAFGSIERWALSFGLSIVIVPLLGFILNYTPLGIRLYPVLVSITIFIVITSVVAWHRQRRLAQEERFRVHFNLNLPTWRRQGLIDKILLGILVAAILGAVGTLIYVIATPRVGEKFTEFYMLGLDGKTIAYPTELKVWEEGSVRIGIINREHEIVSYQLKVRVDGIGNNQMDPIELRHDEKWEEAVSFTPDRAGENQKVEFLLYNNEDTEPYLKLHLWVNTKEQN
ncbi:DUF1616 domain-containing protein [Chloroflexota bacterium]